MRQRCHAAPGSVAPIAATSPACASLVTSDPRQAAGGQRPQEPQPAGAVLGGGDVDAQDLPIPVGVDSDRDQGVHVDHPAPFANLEHQGVGGQEGVRAGIERAGANRLDSVVEFLGHHRHLRLGQTGDAQCFDEFVHPPGGHPEQVAGGHHRGQGPLGAFAAFQQPLREVRAVAQLRDRKIQCACTGVELAVPVPVALVGPIGATFAVAGAAQGVRFGPEQGVDERGQQLTQNVRVAGGESFGEHSGQVDIVGRGHRVDSFARVTLVGLSKNHAVTFIHSATTRRYP